MQQIGQRLVVPEHWLALMLVREWNERMTQSVPSIPVSSMMERRKDERRGRDSTFRLEALTRIRYSQENET